MNDACFVVLPSAFDDSWSREKCSLLRTSKEFGVCVATGMELLREIGRVLMLTKKKREKMNDL